MTKTSDTFLEQRMHESALSQSFYQTPSKSSIPVMVNRIMEQIDEGKADAAEIAVQLKYISELDKALKEALREVVTDGLTKDGITRFGAKIEPVEAGTKYDYENCNDTQWNELNEQLKKVVEKKTEREKFLQQVKKSMVICDEGTHGEEIIINPPIKSSTSTFKVTLAR